MSYPQEGLRFIDLRRANVARCEESFHGLQEWSETDWMCAAAGELGEAANLIKKRRRGETISVASVADEIADTIIYLDLLAARMGINLARATALKFNEVSQRKGSLYKLEVT